jgi:hypothetical protein
MGRQSAAPPCLLPTDVKSVSFTLSVPVKTTIRHIFSQTKQLFFISSLIFSIKDRPSVSSPFREEIRHKMVERVAKEKLFSFGRRF